MKRKRVETIEKRKVMHNVFDSYTEKNIFKLISQNHFDGLESPISVGKEANVFSAKKGKKTVIVKIYRLESCNFNKMFEYIRVDPRYENLAKKKRKIVFAWTQREYRNLFLARSSGARVPTPITFLDNILVEEFIGTTDTAPQLKDALPKDPEDFLKKVVDAMRSMYKKGLIHGDLSGFNILNHNENPVIIDFSQSTIVRSPNAMELLDRDIKNVVSFFKKLGVETTAQEIKAAIV